MRDGTTSVDQELLDLLDREQAGINVTGISALLAHIDHGMIKASIQQLHTDGKVNRLSIMGVQGRYYVYFSLYVRTANGYAAVEPVKVEAPAAPPAPEIVPPTALAEALADVLPMVPAEDPILPSDMAQRLMARLEEDLREDPIGRRTSDKRLARYDVMDVLARWRLPYRLARIVEIAAVARRRAVTLEEAKLIARLAREHARD